MTTTPWGPTGYLAYKRTYARRKNENDPNSATEEFPDTVERIVAACRKQLKVGFTADEEQYLRHALLKLKGSVAGRFLWQLGTKTVDKLGLLSLQNCAATVVSSPIRPFTWAMDALMLGCGVGYNIQKEHVYELPKVRKAKVTRLDTQDADFIVPDSREGWVALLCHVLESHFITGQSFTYSTVCVRSKGALIKGFGGVASGPEELCWGITEISRLLNSRVGKKLNPIHALDIMNIIGFVVVAGNVRRSAQIAIGDMDDPLFLNAKRWDLGSVPNWRAMSNNSVVCNDIDLLPEQFWAGYKGNGEPYGLINMRLSREVGRLGDTRYPDPGVVAFNPCVEQPLEEYETCCLAEIFLPNIESADELGRVAKTLYRINKHSLSLDCHHPETAAVVHRNMRMGIGITGYMQATEEQRSWLAGVYEDLRRYDAEYSAAHGWPRSIKITTVKPSGTLSLLPGVTPGCHPGYAKHFIRRIQIAANHPLITVCQANGYRVEPRLNFDGSLDHNTLVVEFPSAYPEHTVVAKDVTAIEQLEHVKWLQQNWSDNGVSCTVYYDRDELPEVQSWLRKNYNDGVKSCSFLLKTDHGFKQAPYEAITQAQYEDLKSRVKPISGLDLDDGAFDLQDCEGGACPVK